MASTIASTWRSFGAEASRNASVMTSWSATSRITMSFAFLSAAACAAVNANSRARADAGTGLPSFGLYPGSHEPPREFLPPVDPDLPVQLTLGDVLRDTVGHQVEDRHAGPDPLPALRR